MDKNIWLINHYAQHPGGAGGTRHFCLAKYLNQIGWKVTIIASSVEVYTGKQRLEPSESVRLDKYENVEFLWIKTSTYQGNGSARMKNMLEFTFRLLLPKYTRLLSKPDLIIGSSVHPFACWSAAILARKLKVPFVFEVRDLWPETLIQLGRIKRNGIIAKIMLRLERWLYQRADKIITLLPEADKYIAKQGIDTKKVAWIPNGVELNNFVEPLHNNDKFTLMYLGSHGNANALDTELRAIKKLKKNNWHHNFIFRMIGDGPLKPSLIELARELNISELISFESAVSKNEIPSLAAQADAFIVSLINIPLYQYGISLNKIFDYFSAGRPTVFAGNPVNNPILDANAGISVDADDIDAIALAIETIKSMPLEQRLAMGKNGRAYVESHHNYRNLALKLSSELQAIINKVENTGQCTTEQKKL